MVLGGGKMKKRNKKTKADGTVIEERCYKIVGEEPALQ
jgi:hypothetical protein